MIRHEVACKIVSLLADLNINDVSVSEEMEDIMRRSQIIKKFGNDIKQIPDGCYHIRYNGKQIFKKSYDLVGNELLKRENNIGVKTLDSIAEDFFEYRFTNSSGGTYAKDKGNYERFIKGTALVEKDITKLYTLIMS